MLSSVYHLEIPAGLEMPLGWSTLTLSEKYSSPDLICLACLNFLAFLLKTCSCFNIFGGFGKQKDPWLQVYGPCLKRREKDEGNGGETRMHALLHSLTPACTPARPPASAHTQTHTHTQTDRQTYTHTDTHRHTHTHI